MNRRTFFKSSLVGVGALSVPGCASDGAPSLGANPSWADVRAQFELAGGRVHMAGFLLASHPRPVADAIERHRAGFDRDPTTYLQSWHRLRTLPFPVATGWAPSPPGVARAPLPGALLIGATDIATGGLGAAKP